MAFFHIRDLLHTQQRRDETCEHLSDVLGEYCISCELQLSGAECEVQQGFTSLPQEVAEELFSCELSKEAIPKSSASDMAKLKKATIAVDNLLSPVHTLLQIQCVDQKGLIYDILRTSKDCDIQVTLYFTNCLVNAYSLDSGIRLCCWQTTSDVEMVIKFYFL